MDVPCSLERGCRSGTAWFPPANLHISIQTAPGTHRDAPCTPHSTAVVTQHLQLPRSSRSPLAQGSASQAAAAPGPAPPGSETQRARPSWRSRGEPRGFEEEPARPQVTGAGTSEQPHSSGARVGSPMHKQPLPGKEPAALHGPHPRVCIIPLTLLPMQGQVWAGRSTSAPSNYAIPVAKAGQ